RESKNYIDDTEIEVQRRRTAGWELGLTHKQFIAFSAYARGWQRESKNYIDDTEIEVQRRRTAGWELGLTHKQFI
ncbi:hypothetical protein C7E12_22645, partial [Stenotrophomonas maltophilia]